MPARRSRDLSFLEKLRSREELQQAVFRLRDYYGVNQVVYSSTDRHGVRYAALTYNLEWVERYVEQKYQSCDPVYQEALRRFSPFDWAGLDWRDAAASKLRSEALAAGMGHQGYSIPMRHSDARFALFSINSDLPDEAWARFKRQFTEELVFVAHFIDHKAGEFTMATDIRPMARLSPREVDALSLLASGHTRSQASECLNISEHTLRAYVEGARHKLGTQNTVHTVAEALAQGLIRA
ncbi:MAG: autoinducer binding domain-containing protein [Mangrovicoccus sp.]|nr:autoinducer binding domain-containing protein [Mangrovicoccus sp.]